MRILLLGEYSGLHNELKGALTNLGHEVALAAANDFFKKYPVDINLGSGENIYSYKLNQMIMPFLNLRKLVGFDVVHIINFYIFPRNPYLNLWLVKFLKKNNGIVTLSGAGDDPFFVKYSTQVLRYSPIPAHEKYDRKKSYYMRDQRHLATMHEYMNYVDHVIPIMYEYYASFQAAGYKEKVCTPIPIPINIKKIPEIPNKKSDKIIFFHGLNRPGFKGTFLIEKCFSELSKKYPNSVQCLIDGKMSFDKYMQLISKTNVSIDQVFSYSLAMNALYSMAQGKIVLGGCEPESAILYSGILPPAWNIEPDETLIMNLLEKIVSEKEYFFDIAKNGRVFVEKMHNPEKVAKCYENIWNNSRS